jgi:mannose-6-phosphate isomerase-like protein (cupin superfamily)
MSDAGRSGRLAFSAVQIANLDDLESFTTKDGSSIRELAGPAWTAARNQSLAEATVPAGGETQEHYHRETEELYYFTAGSGRMRLGEEERDVRPGDCVVIPPGTRHKLWASGDRPLVLLCACAPAYSHDDTVTTEEI